MPPRRPLALAALLLPPLAAVAVHAPTLEAGFAFDDPVAVVDNPLVDGRAPWTEALARNVWGDRPGWEHLASWRPLAVLTLRLDHARGGGAPGPFHATNLALHVLCVLAALLLAARLDLPPPAAAGFGLAVAVHPAFAEAVASVVGRADLLAGGLSLAGLALWGRRPAWALAVLALALLAKESAVVAVGAAAALALRDRRWGPAAAAAALAVAWYAARAAAVGGLGGAVPAVDNPLAAADPGARLVGSLAVVGRYAGWWLVPRPIPADLGLGVDLAGPGGAWAVAGAATLAGLVALGLHAARRHRRAVLAGVLLAGGSLALLSNALFVLPPPWRAGSPGSPRPASPSPPSASRSPSPCAHGGPPPPSRPREASPGSPPPSPPPARWTAPGPTTPRCSRRRSPGSPPASARGSTSPPSGSARATWPAPRPTPGPPSPPSPATPRRCSPSRSPRPPGARRTRPGRSPAAPPTPSARRAARGPTCAPWPSGGPRSPPPTPSPSARPPPPPCPTVRSRS